MPPKAMARAFKAQSGKAVYDYEQHVALAEGLAAKKALPKTFAALALASPSGAVWTDILRMRTLNTEQSLGGREKHVCPLQLDVVDRVIEFYSAPGDLVFDPFAGLFTVPVRAMAHGRRGIGTELHDKYFNDGVNYLRLAEIEKRQITLFDLLDEEAA